MVMEALRPNLDLKPTHCTCTPTISTEFLRPTSLSLPSHRFSSLLIRSKRRSKLSCMLRHKSDPSISEEQQLIKSIGKGLFGFAAAAAALLSVCYDSPAFSESLTVAFPVSRAREVNTVQRTLVEAWGLIRETFIDPTFNHQDWDSKLQQTMVEMFPLRTSDAAYNKISAMLSTLGDPFTRIISPKEYQSFRIGSDGNLQGVGLFINAEPRTGHLVVLSCVDGSPAARAGIHEGDELIEINGERLDGVDSEAAAQKLRGRAGTIVTVKVHSSKDLGSDSSIREFHAQAYIHPGLLYSLTDLETCIICLKVKIPREYIKLSPISSAIIPHRTADGHLTKTGYVKLSAFSQTAAADMENAIQEMESQDVHAYILDLRNNPVNEGSASASEILAGALHDNGRAILVGHKTFGKGKIQSVTELHDGSALIVTVAKYLSPALHDIDQVGITPDVQCTTDMLNSPKDSLLKDKSSISSLETDFCIMVAEHELDIQQSKGTAT
ncbi:carboxyl-terminal-processing peptidase 3 [Quercus suber]|uniref:C-terminal processing peptidase n=1 Tax=Quercus suber TaxID=58331 RepID=A0AAW0IRN7_QUESU